MPPTLRPSSTRPPRSPTTGCGARSTPRSSWIRRTAQDPLVRPALDRAIELLRYGTVSLNHWSAIGYGLGITPWGAHPGHARTDIGSGIGFVHNPLMFERVEKTVVRSPFRAFPKPMWFIGHRTAHRVVPHLIRFEADRNPAHLVPVAALALRG